MKTQHLRVGLFRVGLLTLIPALSLLGCRVAGGTDGVTVFIVNDAGKTIETVEFWSDSGNQSNPTLLEKTGAIEAGQKSEIVIEEITGEGAYTTQVTFENGEQIEGGAGYVEGGYRVTEIIEATEILSEVNFY